MKARRQPALNEGVTIAAKENSAMTPGGRAAFHRMRGPSAPLLSLHSSHKSGLFEA